MDKFDMFQTQMYFDGFASTTPFVREKSKKRSLSLLQMTQRVRDGHHRLSTPEKTAVLDLSASFEKKRLGKEQQILSDIAKRCREQEIADLSNQIAERMILQENQTSPEVASYMTAYMMKREKTDLSEGSSRTPRKNPNRRKQYTPNSYKYFPARKIIKRPMKIELYRASFPKVGMTYVKGMPRSISNSRSKLLLTRQINGPIQLEHYIQPKQDPLAPLTRDPTSMDNEYRKRIDSSFSTGRMSLGRRANTSVYESAFGVNGPSLMRYKNVKTLKPLKTTYLELQSDPELPCPPGSQASRATHEHPWP